MISGNYLVIDFVDENSYGAFGNSLMYWSGKVTCILLSIDGITTYSSPCSIFGLRLKT